MEAGPRYRVLLLEPIHEKALAWLARRAEVVHALGHDEEYLARAVADVDGLIKRDLGYISERVMAASGRLRVVGRHGVGLESIDVEAATRLGVTVVNTPGANVEAVAEHVLGMMLCLSKGLFRADRALRRGDWEIRYRHTGQELRGRSLGIVGFGRIGQRVAALAAAFGMRVYYHDQANRARAAATLGARKLDLDELLRTCHYVSLHVPLTPETEGLLGARELGLMRRDAFLVNTARGRVVDEAALFEALRDGRLAGAGLDVFGTEPAPADNPLFGLENVVVTPHTAAHTEEAMLAMAEVVKDVVRVLEGKRPRHPANAPPRPRR